MKYAYYPGCSGEGTSSAYDVTSRMVCAALDLDIQEIDDWNCCGTTEYFSIDHLPAYALVARNLALIDPKETPQVIAPCSSCYVNLKKVDENMGKYKQLNADVNEALAAGNLSYKPGSVKARHLLDVICNDVGCEAVAARAVKSLAGLTLVPYYGCYIGRPEHSFDDVENPQTLDRLLAGLGADVPDYSLKSSCCGGHMTQIGTDVALGILHRLLEQAHRLNADAMVVPCPMCQLNLDAYQSYVNNKYKTEYHIPIVYFTQ
ncbi:MAG: CoB--CoM heterodisulfide reductase iron-sulfur subunit B family protein, partial [Anaerolineales bacterium]|nr:CoB--CoM heterodisulfide reductase iron-sulfur subunit B family protein [Anaerolineales bacterium]